MNKTRYAILGVLMEGPSTGYAIKALMERSTRYFWRESDSTIYPMLKRLASEGKVESEVAYVGKKRKEVFSITEEGRAEFEGWLQSPTEGEIQRNEFLLKVFFAASRDEVHRLFRERLAHSEQVREAFQKIEERLEGFADSPRKAIRLQALRYGMAHLSAEIDWLQGEIDD